MSVKHNNQRSRARRFIKATALAISFVFSALMMAMALGSASYSWLAWFGLLPLFLAIRILRPTAAALAGAFWGVCFYFFSSTDATGVISPTLQSLALLTIVPAFYAYFGTLFTRRIGFNPLLLAFGWIVLEFALKPLGLQQGLLAGTQIQNSFLHWISHLLGYLFVAFLVACVNASLLVVLCIARLRFPSWNSSRISPHPDICHLLQSSLNLRLISIFQGYPRPPPLPSRVPA